MPTPTLPNTMAWLGVDMKRGGIPGRRSCSSAGKPLSETEEQFHAVWALASSLGQHARSRHAEARVSGASSSVRVVKEGAGQQCKEEGGVL